MPISIKTLKSAGAHHNTPTAGTPGSDTAGSGGCYCAFVSRGNNVQAFLLWKRGSAPHPHWAPYRGFNRAVWLSPTSHVFKKLLPASC